MRPWVGILEASKLFEFVVLNINLRSLSVEVRDHDSGLCAMNGEHQDLYQCELLHVSQAVGAILVRYACNISIAPSCLSLFEQVRGSQLLR